MPTSDQARTAALTLATRRAAAQEALRQRLRQLVDAGQGDDLAALSAAVGLSKQRLRVHLRAIGVAPVAPQEAARRGGAGKAAANAGPKNL